MTDYTKENNPFMSPDDFMRKYFPSLKEDSLGKKEETYHPVYIPVAFFSSWLHGYTLTKLWIWFVSDTFGIKKLTTSEVWGLNLLINYITFKKDLRKIKKEEKKDIPAQIIEDLGVNVIILFAGWIVHKFTKHS